MALKRLRKPRQKFFYKKTEEMLNSQTASKSYKGFVEPFLPEIKSLARKLAMEKMYLIDTLVQEASINIIAAKNNYKGTGPKKAYAMTVARYAMIKVLKKEKIGDPILEIKTPKHFEQMPVREKIFGLRRIGRGKRFKNIEEIQAFVNQAFEKSGLREDTKKTARFYWGLDSGEPKSYKETANRIGIPVSTARYRIFLVRKVLEKALEKK